ncbi:MAG: response regulator transcription factor [Bacillota bacterium]
MTKKILIVDDEPSLRFLISSALEDEGYYISEAADGLEAYDLIRKQKPDLIILDVMMPGMTGIELCEKLKKDLVTKNIIILMLTAKGQLQDKIESEKVGADYYLRKPFSPIGLLEIVDGLLNKNNH